MTLLKDWFKSSLTGLSKPLSWSKGKCSVTDEAVDGGGSDQERAGNIACHSLASGDLLKKSKRAGSKMTLHCIEKDVKRGCVVVNQRLKEARERGECDQTGDHAGAVDGEALEPLAEIVAFGAEDEELVSKVGDRNIQRHGQYRRQNYREVQKAKRQSGVEQGKDDGEIDVSKKGVEHPNTNIAGELPSGEATDEALEPSPRKEGVLRDGYDRRMLRANLVARRGRLFHGGEIWFQMA